MSDGGYDLINTGELKLDTTDLKLKADESEEGTCRSCGSESTKRVYAGNGEPTGSWCAHCGTMNYRDGTFVQPAKYSDHVLD